MEKTVLLTVDLEQDWGAYVDTIENIKKGLPKILRIFDQFGVTATFFTTGSVAERVPKEIKKIARKHEIASHSYSHSLLNTLSNEKIVEEVRDSKKVLEKVSGKPVIGFRAPRFIFPKSVIQELEKFNYKYDSSMVPSFRLGRYSNLSLPREPFKLSKKLWEFPISTLNLLRIPLSLDYMQIVNFNLFMNMFKVLRPKSPILIYLHSFTFEKLEETEGVPWKCRKIYYRKRGKETEENLIKLLEKVKEMEYEITSIEKYLKTINA